MFVHHQISNTNCQHELTKRVPYCLDLFVWRHLGSMKWWSLTCHSALKKLKRGLLLAAPQFFPSPLYGKVVDIIAHVGFSLCAQSMHRVQGLCTLPHVPLLCSHSSHCLAVTEWCHGHCVSMAIASDMLYLCASYSHWEGSQCEHIFFCLKDRWQLPTTNQAFTQAILGYTWEQGVHALTSQFRPATIKIVA